MANQQQQKPQQQPAKQAPGRDQSGEDQSGRNSARRAPNPQDPADLGHDPHPDNIQAANRSGEKARH